ncbi:MAG: hypothetical protein ABSB26_02620 [Nitrososphaerales archaeon]
MAPGGKLRHRKTGGARRYYLAAGMVVIVAASVIGWYAYLLTHSNPEINGTSSTMGTSKPVILYVNQGNGAVNVTNFDVMADCATSHGFNVVFFQIYRQGILLFSQQNLQTFVNQAHLKNLRIFFSLWITNSSQHIPSSIYVLGEDGVNLDMSMLSPTSQQSLLVSLKADYRGKTAVTTTDMNSTLKPDLLVLETYGISLQHLIKHGAILSVGVYKELSQADYQSQLQYALQNSDGVMVFDYAGLLKSGY